jgi:hypothetical protein
MCQLFFFFLPCLILIDIMIIHYSPKISNVRLDSNFTIIFKEKNFIPPHIPVLAFPNIPSDQNMICNSHTYIRHGELVKI